MCNCISPTVIYQYLQSIQQELCNIGTMIPNNDGVTQIVAMLAHDYPMSVAAEYPTELEDRVVYSTEKVRFLDMLNPKLYVLFKGIINVDKPVYFKDTSGYEHIVSLTDGGEPVMASDLINNHPYESLYIGNYIVLES